MGVMINSLLRICFWENDMVQEREYKVQSYVLILIFSPILSFTSLCRRHTVPKLTPDGHTNMEFWISREDGPELGQQPINSRSKYDAYRRSHDGTRTTHEGNTKMWIFIVVYTRRTHEGHTKATRWLHDVVLRVRCVRTRSRRRHVTSRWYKTFGRPWEIQLLIADYWEQNTQYI